MSSRLNYLLFKCLSISLVICTHSTLSHKHTHTQVRLGNNLSIHCPTAVSVIFFVTIACSLYICLPVVSVCTAQLSGDSVSRTVCGPRGMPATVWRVFAAPTKIQHYDCRMLTHEAMRRSQQVYINEPSRLNNTPARGPQLVVSNWNCYCSVRGVVCVLSSVDHLHSVSVEWQTDSTAVGEGDFEWVLMVLSLTIPRQQRAHHGRVDVPTSARGL